ncbi:hypothetical protein ACSDR0_42380 [Streptosporangium sp. G11]|uniref:hypothetical protein n=1 Tax=Streptosporangium sp. G11 TaxID=3436926 RepID=UPI003EBEB1B7
MLSPVAPSMLHLPDGRKVRWSGFFTGPRVLDDDRIAALAERLLGLGVSAVPAAAERELAPYHALPGHRPPALLLHSTTATLRALDGDVAELAGGRDPHDVATYVETRAVFLGTGSDLSVGRTAPWAEAVEVRGVPAVDIGDREHYYLSQALLVLAERHERGEETVLGEIVDWLRARPDAVIRLYALDLETQIFLLWLRRETGLARLVTDANKPAVAARWNRKSHIHPRVDDAHALNVDGLSVDKILDAEQRIGEGYRKLAMHIPVLPGYLIPRDGVDLDGFVTGTLRAARLLRERYGLGTAALKPSEAGDGARIVGGLDLSDTDRLVEAARAAHPHGDDYLLEAWVDFLTLSAGGEEHPVAPSGHFRNGEVTEGVTLQTLNRFSWVGNLFLDEAGWTGLGLPVDAYRTIRRALRSIHEAFLGPHSVSDGSHQGLVTGGVDFAVGRVGGRFGDRVLVGAIDFNLSSHGGEYLRAFREEVCDGTERYAATRVFRPSSSATLRRLEAATLAGTRPGGRAGAVACVPERWGMIASTGSDPAAALHGVRRLIELLAREGLTATA